MLPVPCLTPLGGVVTTYTYRSQLFACREDPKNSLLPDLGWYEGLGELEAKYKEILAVRVIAAELLASLG
ncbi:hypothetical protein NKDENANG_01052 [Candidatus Entotheonellaceae bacterium PAL068K]